jgi:hypothetical protein
MPEFSAHREAGANAGRRSMEEMKSGTLRSAARFDPQAQIRSSSARDRRESSLAMLIGAQQLYPGLVVVVRPLGVLRMTQTDVEGVCAHTRPV